MSGGPTDGTVEVVPYDSTWPASFEVERVALSAAMPCALSIEHIGSTSVQGLASKPTLDILVVVPSVADVVACVGALEAIGYDYRGPRDGEHHQFFRKVSVGKRTHHLHVLTAGSSEPDEYRLFREFLVAVPSAAARYEAYKWELAAAHANERMAYVSAKEKFVDGLMIEAEAWSAARRIGEAT